VGFVRKRDRKEIEKNIESIKRELKYAEEEDYDVEDDDERYEHETKISEIGRELEDTEEELKLFNKNYNKFCEIFN
jgi:septal ring factor EnvC (AmiA/AmiB activator)